MHELSGFMLFVCFILVILFSTVLLRALRLRRVFILEYQRGVLFVRGVFRQVLGPGSYWSSTSRRIQLIDTRLQTLNVAGQEVLSADGMSLKITLAGEYRVTDPARFLLTSVSAAASLYQDAQQSLREAVAGLSFENLLNTRSAINTRMQELLATRSTALGIELTRIEVRDIVLPGELKRAFAQSITAQKEGLAALERARAETAALRSLANAARLMQDHPGLLQLRAVQAMEAVKSGTLTLEFSSQADKSAN